MIILVSFLWSLWDIVLASSVCPLMDKDKRQASWCEGLVLGKTGFCSRGQDHAQYTFNTIFCCWVVQCSLSVSCLAWGNPVLESKGSMVRLLQTSTRTYANQPFPGLLLPPPLSLKQAMPSHTSAGDPQTLTNIKVMTNLDSMLKGRDHCQQRSV